MDWAGFHVAVEPAVDGLEGDTELLGKLRLAEPVFKPVGVELVNQVLRHGRPVYNITTYRVCQRESSKVILQIHIPLIFK